jgi:hypothetical protein
MTSTRTRRRPATQTIDPRGIEFKYNNCGAWTKCAVCAEIDRADVGFQAFIQGTYDWLCYECLEKCLPGGQAALNALMKAENAAFEQRSRAESSEANAESRMTCRETRE